MTTISSVAARLKENALFRLYYHYVIESALILKREGVKQLIRKRGWKFLVVICCYYLIRDTLLYIVLPFCLARGIL